MPFLQITGADGNPQRVSIDQDTLRIGRSSDNDLVLEDDVMSSHHCQIDRDGEGYTLKDLGSTNGTRLNEQPVKESRLQLGDVIVVGKTFMEFCDESSQPVPAGAEESAAPAPPAPVAGELPPGFESRRDSRGAGLGVLVAAAAVVLGVAIWFVIVLLRP